MASIYLHNHKDFPDLLKILESETNILSGLIEKYYWIMHVLYGLKQQGYDFQLKGGTSLSKGFGLISRFSEDIDIHITPPKELGINENPKNNKPANIQKKKDYYDRLAREIKIDGIVSIERDTLFDNPENYNSGGIRLYYKKLTGSIGGVKDGILLEAGYDTVTPNMPVTITSWALDRAKATSGIDIIDNRAFDVACYDYRYTFVEKLQTIATKFRKEMNTGETATNYMRQYFDVYSLLADKAVQEFIGTEAYKEHKERRFPKDDLITPLGQNEAFLLNDRAIRDNLRKRYELTSALYYKGQPPFDEILNRIHLFLDRL